MYGRAIHFEIPVDDPGRAMDFYRRALAWDPVQWGDQPYWSVGDGRDDGIGIRGALTPRSLTASHVIVYIDVEDIDRTLDRVAAAGGQVVMSKEIVPGIGWIARIRDSEGNDVGLLQADSLAGRSSASG